MMYFKNKIKFYLAVAAQLASAASMTAFCNVIVTASRDYVDRKTTLHPSSNGVEQAGYFLGTQTNKVLASKDYVDSVIGDTRSDRITDGTNIIDAARMVFQLQDGYGEWSWTIEPEAADASFEIHWGDSYGVYDGWYFDGGIGEWVGPDYYLGGDVTSTNLTYTGFFGHETEYTVTFSRPVIHGSLTNIVGRLALTNDVSQVASLARSKTDLAVYASETTQWRCIYVEPSGAYSNLTNMNLWTLDPYPYDGVIYPNVYYDGTFMFDSSEIMIEDEYNKATLWTIYGSGESGDGIRISFSRQVAGLDTGNRLATTSDIPSVVSADLTPATNYTDHTIAEFSRTGTVERAHSIYDGTNVIDAAGNVWRVDHEWNFAGATDSASISLEYDYEENAWVMTYYDDLQGSDSGIVHAGENADRLEFHLDNAGVTVIATRNANIYVGKLALTNDIPDAPDFSTGNTQLVQTILDTAPAPGNYIAVSNAAMNARDKADLSLYNVTNTFSAWEYYDVAPGITEIAQAEWTDYLGAWSVTLLFNGERFLATIDGSSQDALSIRYDNPPVTFSARRERVGIIVVVGGLVTTNSAGDVLILGSFSQGTNTTASGAYSHAEGDRTIASGKASHAEGVATRAQAEASHASGVNVFITQRATFGAGVSVSGTNSASFIWSGSETSPWYGTHGKGSFNVNPIGGAYGFFIGNDNLIQVISSSLLAEEPQEITIEYDDGQPVTTNYPSLRAVVEQIVLETIRKNSLSGIYDQQLQTWWTPVMVNGGYKFMATTNIDMNAESEY